VVYAWTFSRRKNGEPTRVRFKRIRATATWNGSGKGLISTANQTDIPIFAARPAVSAKRGRRIMVHMISLH